ncbi:mitotic checkpoint serine/threonine-protein kinase BUB1 beta [Microcaecilia unicolor]|uniref:Mitotic checkpoint serine/threonine-protein kinase BUB1 beta n=1 Tax=Microcaecilia unicolor TaxID=1415580 RepID=A0A6P7Z1B1_9AMPH|nr:mitotic checkpoint serine/threonine-protein kinase BUB1 beta [Microcaecilia unicolor]
MAEGGDEWELSKENVQPLRQGRVMSTLQEVLTRQESTSHLAMQQQKQAFEWEIRFYSGEDPLDVWDRYISWTEQTFPQGGKESNLSLLLERAVKVFHLEKRYYEDPRYLNLWLKFKNICSEPLDLYSYLHSQGIGTSLASLYITWAEEYEARGNNKKADAIFQEGLQCKAKPLNKLQCHHRQFQARVAQQVLQGISEGGDAEDAGFLEAPEPQRVSLAVLKGKGKKKQAPVNRVMDIVKPLNAQLPPPQQIPGSSSRFKVFDENVVTTPGAELHSLTPQLWPAPPLARAKENDQRAGPWNSGRYPRSSHALEVTSSLPSFTPYVEESAQPAITPCKINPTINGVLSARKPGKEEDPLQRIQSHPEEKEQKLMYCKDKVCAGVEEFSFEEIRAEVYLKKMRKKREEKLQATEQRKEELEQKVQEMERLRKKMENEDEQNLVEQPAQLSKPNAMVSSSPDIPKFPEEQREFAVFSHLLLDPVKFPSHTHFSLPPSSVRESKLQLRQQDQDQFCSVDLDLCASTLSRPMTTSFTVFDESLPENRLIRLSAPCARRPLVPVSKPQEPVTPKGGMMPEVLDDLAGIEPLNEEVIVTEYNDKTLFPIPEDTCDFMRAACVVSTPFHGVTAQRVESEPDSDGTIKETETQSLIERTPNCEESSFSQALDVKKLRTDDCADQLRINGFTSGIDYKIQILDDWKQIQKYNKLNKKLQATEQRKEELEQKVQEMERLRKKMENEDEQNLVEQPAQLSKPNAMVSSSPDIPKFPEEQREFAVFSHLLLDPVKFPSHTHFSLPPSSVRESKLQLRQQDQDQFCSVDLDLCASTLSGPMTTSFTVFDESLPENRLIRLSAPCARRPLVPVSKPQEPVTPKGGMMPEVLDDLAGIEPLNEEVIVTEYNDKTLFPIPEDTCDFMRAACVVSTPFHGVTAQRVESEPDSDGTIKETETQSLIERTPNCEESSFNQALDVKKLSIQVSFCDNCVQMFRSVDWQLVDEWPVVQSCGLGRQGSNFALSTDTSRDLGPILEVSQEDTRSSVSSSASSVSNTLVDHVQISGELVSAHSRTSITNKTEDEPPVCCGELHRQLLEPLQNLIISSINCHQETELMPRIQEEEDVKLGSENYHVKQEVVLDEDSKIYLGALVDTPTQAMVAIKVDSQPVPWDFYINLQLKERLGVQYWEEFQKCHCFLYQDGCIMLYEELTSFSVWSVIPACDPSNQNVIMVLASHLLRLIEQLHTAEIVHGNLHPGIIFLGNGTGDILSYNKNTTILKLVDFTHSVDMRLHPLSSFNGFPIIVTEQAQQILSEGSSPYQVDLLGIAEIVHLLLFGEQLQVHQEDFKWKLSKIIPKYLNSELWTRFFEMILNTDGKSTVSVLRELGEEMKPPSSVYQDLHNLLHLLRPSV